MTDSKRPNIDFIITPALSSGSEGKFDADATDFLVAFNARGDIFNCIEASDELETESFVRDNSEHRVAAKTHMVLTGFQQVTPGNIRVACGIYQIALDTARRMKAKRITILLSKQQFRGSIKQLAALIKCRTDHFMDSAADDESLREVELLCRNSDVENSRAGLESTTSPLCRTCFH